jgi:hypothetical protein
VSGTFYRLEPASSNGSTVKAEWQTVNVTIGPGGARDRTGTCELIDLIHKRVLPLFPARNVKFQSTCFPHTLLIKGSTLQADVLKPVAGAHVASAGE